LHFGLPSPRAESERRAPQFTSIDFIKALKDAHIQISMDGKGAWRDNVFVKRLWCNIFWIGGLVCQPKCASAASV
jgi:hypothetical protein